MTLRRAFFDVDLLNCGHWAAIVVKRCACRTPKLEGRQSLFGPIEEARLAGRTVALQREFSLTTDEC
jgi:hypothetical protein